MGVKLSTAGPGQRCCSGPQHGMKHHGSTAWWDRRLLLHREQAGSQPLKAEQGSRALSSEARPHNQAPAHLICDSGTVVSRPLCTALMSSASRCSRLTRRSPVVLLGRFLPAQGAAQLWLVTF